MEIDQLKKIGGDQQNMNVEGTRLKNKISKLTVDPITGTAK